MLTRRGALHVDAVMTPEMTSCDVTEFYRRTQGLGIGIWIDGGWGGDALLGVRSCIAFDPPSQRGCEPLRPLASAYQS